MIASAMARSTENAAPGAVTFSRGPAGLHFAIASLPHEASVAVLNCGSGFASVTCTFDHGGCSLRHKLQRSHQQDEPEWRGDKGG